MYSAVKIFLLKSLLILLAPVWVCAQQKDVGSWHTINVQLTTKNKWMGFAELQTRSRKPADQYDRVFLQIMSFPGYIGDYLYFIS